MDTTRIYLGMFIIISSTPFGVPADIYSNSSLVCAFAPLSSWSMECCLYISSCPLLQEGLPWVPIILAYTPLVHTCK